MPASSANTWKRTNLIDINKTQKKARCTASFLVLIKIKRTNEGTNPINSNSIKKSNGYLAMKWTSLTYKAAINKATSIKITNQKIKFFIAF